MTHLSRWINTNNSILESIPKFGIAISKVIETNFERKSLSKSQNLSHNFSSRNLLEASSMISGEILMSIRLPTPADHGILFPVLKSLNQKEIKCHLITTERNYSKYKDEIDILKHTRVSYWENQKISISELVFIPIILFNLFKSFVSFLIGKKSKNDHFLLSSFPKLIAFYSFYELKSRVLHKNISNNTKVLLSLGDQIFGFLKETRKIDHIGMQHGLVLSKSFSYWSGLVPLNINEFFVYGQSSLKLIGQAYPNLKSTIVGNPYFDSFKHQEKSNRKKIKIIFFTSFHSIISNGDTSKINALTECLNEFVKIKASLKRKFDFEIKPHPNDNLEYLNDIFDDEIIIDTSYPNAIAALQNCDIAITIGSTVDMEAVLMSVYSVNLRIQNVSEYSNPIGEEMSIEKLNQFLNDIQDYDDLVKEIDLQYRRLSYHMSFHGDSTEKVVNLLIAKLKS